MGVIISTSYGVPSVDDIQLVVELDSPTVVAVRAGSILVAGVEYSFSEDQLFEMTSVPGHDQWIDGFLCFDTEVGGIVLLVDESEYGAVTERFNFDAQTKYKLLNYMYDLRIPAGAVDLNGLDIGVSHVIPDPVEE